jgi:hypothetical protein
VAQRLGFQLEGVLREAQIVGTKMPGFKRGWDARARMEAPIDSPLKRQHVQRCLQLAMSVPVA